MLEVVIDISLMIITLSMLVMVYRVMKGPSMADRVIALDAIGICLVAFISLVSMMLDTYAFLDVILLIGILAFIGTVAFSKYLEKGVILERERND